MKNNYKNLLSGKRNLAKIFLEDKKTGDIHFVHPNDNKYEWSWTILDRMYHFERAFDENDPIVSDIYNGVSGKESVNFFFDLEEAKVIDSILFDASENEDYLPTKVNFYIGNTKSEVIGKNAAPVKAFTEKCMDGKYRFDFPEKKAQYVRMEVLESDNPYYTEHMLILISLFGIYGYENSKETIKYNVTVDKNTVLCEDFRGVGNNLWVSALPETPNERGIFSNEAYMNINYLRINKIKPAFMRMMVMPFWLLDKSDGKGGAENWAKGIYNFNSPDLEVFFGYVKAFKEAGCDVQLNMGGRISEDMIDWFAFKGYALSEGGSRSAPRDLEAFTKATVALLKECYRRGLDNVNMLSFFNETNGGNFEAFGDKRFYWCKMLELTHKELVKEGLRDKITIIGSDLSGYANDEPIVEYLDYVRDHASEYYDVLSLHIYPKEHKYRYITRLCNQIGKLYPGILVTEYTTGKIKGTNTSDLSFGGSEACQVMAHSNAGLSGSAGWFLCSQIVPVPPVYCNLSTLNEVFWDFPSRNLTAISAAYPENALLMRYIPKHCKTLFTNCNCHDILASAYKKGDDFTVITEVDNSDIERKVTIDFITDIDKPINKFVFEYPEKREDYVDDANGILHIKSATITTKDGIIHDTLPSTHSLIIYTTLDEIIQVELANVDNEVTPNGSVKLEVSNVYGTDIKDVKWSVICGNGTVDANGVYTASGDKKGDTVAIKALSLADNDAYAVAIIRII